MSSPRQALTRLIHHDNLLLMPKYEFKLVEDKIYKHYMACKICDIDEFWAIRRAVYTR